jgi:hypothetical protein
MVSSLFFYRKVLWGVGKDGIELTVMGNSGYVGSMRGSFLWEVGE